QKIQALLARRISQKLPGSGLICTVGRLSILQWPVEAKQVPVGILQIKCFPSIPGNDRFCYRNVLGLQKAYSPSTSGQPKYNDVSSWAAMRAKSGWGGR